MLKSENQSPKIHIPNGFIVLISGGPGVGKTTVSYALQQKFKEFKIILETDIIREAIRGYNHYLNDQFVEDSMSKKEIFDIKETTKPLTYEELCEQSSHMKKSLEFIISRQKRRKISTIINGVHVIPEILSDICDDDSVLFINLHNHDVDTILNRLKERDPNSFKLNHMENILDKNKQLYESILKLSNQSKYTFQNIDITNISIEEIISKISLCIQNKLEKGNKNLA